MTINEKIVQGLTFSGKTQKELAESIKVSKSTLNNWLKLGRDIPAQYIVPICEFIGTSVDYMLYGEGDAPHSPTALKEDEVYLLMFYQNYKNGTDYSGFKLEDFFPDAKMPAPEISENGREMLSFFEELPPEQQRELIGEARVYHRMLSKESGPMSGGKAV